LLKGRYQPSAELRQKMLEVLNATASTGELPQVTWDNIFETTCEEDTQREDVIMPNTIVIFDTTLRDGEQSPGASMNIGETLEVARQLARLGVDVIEAGFPAS